MSTPSTALTTSGTYTASATPNKVLFAAAKKHMRVGTGLESFFYIPLPARLKGARVVSAVLEVTMAAGTGTRTLRAQRTAKPRVSYAATHHNNRPGVLPGSSMISKSQSAATRTWSFDVTADLAAVAAGGAYQGWRLTSTFAGAWLLEGTSASLRPRLKVELSWLPAAPTGLGPAGITALAAPTFTWAPTPGITYAQVQVAAAPAAGEAPDFTAPLWDSGEVPVTAGQIESAALGWAGLSVDQSVVWRVRQATTAGWSPYSTNAALRRRALPTVVFVSPGAVTTDPTPVAVVDYAGAHPQARYRYTVTDQTTGKVLYDTGNVPGDDEATDTPTGATKPGQKLVLRWQSADDQNRAASPGDPGCAEAVLVTTYQPGTAAAVSALDATQAGESPWVDLWWARDVVPDGWIISRDDVIVARLDSLDADAQPVWSWRDWSCPPNRDVVYEIRPMQDGGAGHGVAAGTRTHVNGAWVGDPATGIEFTHTGDRSGLAYAESVAWYEPIGSSRPRKRTFAQRGLEGTVGGYLVQHGDLTVHDLRAAVLAVKDHPSNVVRVVDAAINIPALLADLTHAMDPDRTFVSPTSAQLVDTVDMSVRQVGELPFGDGD